MIYTLLEEYIFRFSGRESGSLVDLRPSIFSDLYDLSLLDVTSPSRLTLCAPLLVFVSVKVVSNDSSVEIGNTSRF